MEEPLRNLTGPQVIALMAIIFGSICLTIVILTSIIVPYSKRLRQVEIEAQLKRDMVAAGFSAADIEQVIRVTSTDGASSDELLQSGKITPSKISRSA